MDCSHWIADDMRPTCQRCHEDFTVFTRRHHCRCCGEVFCRHCSRYRSSHIEPHPIREGVHHRVCYECFHTKLSFAVTWHSWGFMKNQLFGSCADAQKFVHKKLSPSSSRMVSRMSDGAVVSHWFRSGEWERRIRNAARGYRGKVVRTQVQHDAGGDAATRRNVSAGSVGEELVIMFVAQSEADGQWMTRCVRYNARDGRAAIVAQFVASVEQSASGVCQAGAFTLKGETLHIFKRATFKFKSTTEREALAEFRAMKCVVVWHWNGGVSHKLCNTLEDGVHELDLAPVGASAAIVDSNATVIASRCCDNASWVETLLQHAGKIILPEIHHVHAVAVHAPGMAPTITKNMFTAKKQATAASTPVAVFVLASSGAGGATASGSNALLLVQTNTNVVNVPLTTAECEAMVSALREVETAAPESARDEQRDEASGEGSKPVTMFECRVCFEPYNTLQRKPVLCVSCGNSLCLDCYPSVKQCPMCRSEYDTTKPPVVNITILQAL
jgi:hypothetical protein